MNCVLCGKPRMDMTQEMDGREMYFNFYTCRCPVMFFDELMYCLRNDIVLTTFEQERMLDIAVLFDRLSRGMPYTLQSENEADLYTQVYTYVKKCGSLAETDIRSEPQREANAGRVCLRRRDLDGVVP